MTTYDSFINKCKSAFKTEFQDRAAKEAKYIYNNLGNDFDLDSLENFVVDYVQTNDNIRYDYIRDTAEDIAGDLLMRENDAFLREFIKSFNVDYIRENFDAAGIDYEIDNKGNPVDNAELEQIADAVMHYVEFGFLYPFEEGLATDAETVFIDLVIQKLYEYLE